jgi:TonB family protein
MLARNKHFVLGLLVAIGGVLSAEATVSVPKLQILAPVSLEAREGALWRLPVRAAAFSDVPHTSAKERCEKARDPEALTTPNPILDNAQADMRIRVSFIVGTDGRVHSPLILESGDSGDVRAVLNAVRSWRYRPGTCNGVPTETEGKVEFSSR